MTSSVNNECLRLTKNWLDNVIIGQNFCPFAKKPRIDKSIRFHVSITNSTETLLMELEQEFNHLDNNPETETTLIIYKNSLRDFDDFLDSLYLANQYLDSLNYSGIYQIASFHPAYKFEGEPDSSISHYTNRSPFPILHIIREDSISSALKSVANPELIPERNISHAHSLGKDFFVQFLK